jgi:predicted protein tyrosine phosphatase
MGKDLQVTIMCLEEALDLAKKGDSRVHMISIRNSSDPRGMYATMDSDPDKWAGLCKLEMDDIEFEDPRYHTPNIKHIEKAMHFAKTVEDKLVVHCTAGVCRSSAIAYLCACAHMPYEDAVKFVNPKNHWPNRLIVDLGAEYFKDRKVYNVLRDHMQTEFYARSWPRVGNNGYGV